MIFDHKEGDLVNLLAMLLCVLSLFIASEDGWAEKRQGARTSSTRQVVTEYAI